MVINVLLRKTNGILMLKINFLRGGEGGGFEHKEYSDCPNNEFGKLKIFLLDSASLTSYVY